LRLKILKKLRTANLNAEFTGSYKTWCTSASLIFFLYCVSMSVFCLSHSFVYLLYFWPSWNKS